MPDQTPESYVVDTAGLPDGYVPPSASLTPPTSPDAPCEHWLQCPDAPRPWSRNRWGNVVDAEGEVVIEVGDSDVLDLIVRAVNSVAGGAGPSDDVEVVQVVPSRDFAPADELLLVRLDGRKSGRVTIGHSRLPVDTIVGELVAGTDHERITASWPGATPEVLRVLARLVDDLGLRAGASDTTATRSAVEAVARCFADGAEVAPSRSSEFYREIVHQVVTALRAAGAVVPDPEETPPAHSLPHSHPGSDGESEPGGDRD